MLQSNKPHEAYGTMSYVERAQNILNASHLPSSATATFYNMPEQQCYKNILDSNSTFPLSLSHRNVLWNDWLDITVCKNLLEWYSVIRFDNSKVSLVWFYITLESKS